MCGRYAIVSPIHELLQAFGLAMAPESLTPKYNAAPGQFLPVVTNTEPRRLSLCRWGLVPSWAKDEKVGYKMINARAETLAEKPSFREALKRRRCLVPVDGFYEWKKTGEGKQPHFVRLRDQKPFALAGLWERWDKGGEPLFTFTIATTSPNALMAGLHHRMPVILAEADWEAWLAPGPLARADLDRLLVPFSDRQMEAYPVSAAVNAVANDGPELIRTI